MRYTLADDWYKKFAQRVFLITDYLRTRDQMLGDALVQLADNALASGDLPVLRTDPAVLVSLLQAADEHALWRSILPLAEMLDEPTRDAFALAAAQLPRAAIARAAQAVLIGELWEPMFAAGYCWTSFMIRAGII